METEILRALPRRRRSAHKGDFGRVLIVGSGTGMPGAARLAGEACLRVGAGLVTVAVAPENVAAISAGRPELICLPLVHEGELRRSHRARGRHRDRSRASGGPTGRARRSTAVLDSRKPLVVDADALNLVAEAGTRARDNWILTPHPGEAGGCSASRRMMCRAIGSRRSSIWSSATAGRWC